MRAHCQAQQGLLEILYGFELDAIQKTERTENNVNKLSGSTGKRSFLASPIIQGTLYVFGLSFVNKLSEPPGKRKFLALSTFLDSLCS